MALAGDKTTALMMDASFSYYLQEAFRVDCGIEWQEDLTHKKNDYRLNLGVSINPLDVDWANLF